jgi:hypothetical protein
MREKRTSYLVSRKKRARWDPEVARAYHVPQVKGNRALAKRQNPP